jgi:hypothetical protein
LAFVRLWLDSLRTAARSLLETAAIEDVSLIGSKKNSQKKHFHHAEEEPEASFDLLLKFSLIPIQAGQHWLWAALTLHRIVE